MSFDKMNEEEKKRFVENNFRNEGKTDHHYDIEWSL